MSADRLDELLRVTRDHPGLHAWLARGLEAWREGMPLERALCLDKSKNLALRDAYLRRAAELLDPKRQLKPWPLAEALATRIARFESGVLQRIRHRDDVLGVNGALLAAWKCGGGLPRSAHHLYRNVLTDMFRPECQ